MIHGVDPSADDTDAPTSGGLEVLRLLKANKAAAQREFDASLDIEKREGIDVDLWRCLP